MKKLLTIALTLCATSAMACPDLSGTYQCAKDSNDPSDSGVITISTTQAQDGNTVYLWADKDDPSNTGKYPTDGKTYQADDQGTTYVGTCAGEAFSMHLEGVDAQMGQYSIDVQTHLDAAKNLVQDGVFKLISAGQQQAFSETCTRL